MEQKELTVAELQAKTEGIDAANGWLMDALLLVIRQHLPHLLPAIQLHFDQMVAGEHPHLSAGALEQMKVRAFAIQQKFPMLQSLPVAQKVLHSTPKPKPSGKRR